MHITEQPQEEKIPKEKVLRVVKDGITALMFLKHAQLHESQRKFLYFLFFPDSWLTENPERIPRNAAGTFSAMYCLTAFYDVSDLRNYAQDDTILWNGDFPVSAWKGIIPYEDEQHPCFTAISKGILPIMIETFLPEAISILFPNGLPEHL